LRLQVENDRLVASEKELYQKMSEYQQECMKAKGSAEISQAQIRHIQAEMGVKE
jgi:hypothetical protein